MSRKTSAARRAAFFQGVRETGNQTIAAERARVSRSWVTLHRSTDPAFRAELEAAMAEFRASFDKLRAQSGGVAPPSGWGSLDGEELVIRGSNGRRRQIARARLKQWTPRAEQRFLQVLGATCNVKAACAAVGLTPASAYNHRQRWPRFAGQWAAAVEQGYVRVETALIQNANNLVDWDGEPLEIDLGPMTVADAIHILHMHKNEVRGVGRKPGAWRRPRSLDEVRDSILRKFHAIASAASVGDAERERIGRDYARRQAPPPRDRG